MTAVFKGAHPVLAWAAVANAAIAVVALGALLVTAAPILGVHPALKPLKFALSVAVFLASMAVVLPSVQLGAGWRQAIAWTLVLTMLAEMVPILVQPLRGTTSHFNTRGGLDAAFWRVMLVAILIATFTVAVTAAVATIRPLTTPTGAPMAPALALAWRAGLWFFLLAAVSGFAMGGRGSHSVGGVDGGAGLPLVNWSKIHGDLRVSHFFALHALQALPATALLTRALPSVALRVGVVATAIAVNLLLSVATLLQALAGRPLW